MSSNRRLVALLLILSGGMTLFSLSVTSVSAQEFAAGPEINLDVESPFASVAAMVMPAVVSIRASKPFTHPEVGDRRKLERFFNPDMEMPGSGSGFVISTDGLVLTNNHVIEGATSITVMLPGDRSAYDAEIVGVDPSTDLALLRIDPEDHELAALRFADSEAVRVGDWAIAIGNPLGELAGSLTVGVISAKGRRDLRIQGANLRYQDFMQTDAAINFGNSGGPLVDIHGRVIGVNTAINASGQNIGFTIPSNLAARIATQLRDNGRVIRGYLGINMGELTPELAEGRDLSIDTGVLVTVVQPGRPADLGGIQVDDIIIEFDGKSVTTTDDLRFFVADSPVGATVSVMVHRSGRDIDIAVTLIEYPEEELLVASTESGDSPERADSWLGLTVGDLNDFADPKVQELLDTFGIEHQTGVLVLEVESGSPADDARVLPGDVIVEVVTRPIDDVGDFLSAARHYRDRTKRIALAIRRGQVTSFLSVDPVQE